MPISRSQVVEATAKVLLVVASIGALNWGLIGFFNFNLVAALVGGSSAAETSAALRVIYGLVGLTGLAGLFMLPKLHCRPVLDEPAYGAMSR